RAVSNHELLTLECDVLIPAALEAQLRGDNAEDVRARLVVEAANGPTTPRADAVLLGRGVPVLPDILANAGGVTVSYFEWVQNIENERGSEADVNAKLKAKREQATDAVLERQKGIGAVDLRTAALALAVDRVANVAKERGIWP